MKLILFLVLLIGILECKAKIAKLSNSVIVMYWGQDSAGGEPSLGDYCSQADYDIINISFMISFIDTRQPTCAVPNAPDLNFANHGDSCTTYPNCPFLLNCGSTIGVDIQKCQSAGKKIVLSLGGAVGSYGFKDNQQATAFSQTMWDMFFEGNSTLRPFGSAILDGIDLDIEGGSTTGYATFVKAMRTLMSKSNKDYIISGAPQCPYPDAYLGPSPGTALGDAGTAFSYVSVQFYNNYCGINSPQNFWQTFEQWHSDSLKNGHLVMVGLPSAPNAGGGYVPASTVCGFISRLKTYVNYGGFMFWDASWDLKNGWYTKQIRACM